MILRHCALHGQAAAILYRHRPPWHHAHAIKETLLVIEEGLLHVIEEGQSVIEEGWLEVRKRQ